MAPPIQHVVVVVLNFNGWQDTLGCVTSVLEADKPNKLSIVVADNASKDGSIERLAAHFDTVAVQGVPLRRLTRSQADRGEHAHAPDGQVQLVLIDNGGNLGFAGGCNPGIRWAMAAQASHVWLLNNDTTIDPHALQALLDRFQARPEMGLCGSKLIYQDPPDMIQARGGAVFDPIRAIGRHLGVGERLADKEDVAVIESQMQYVVGASMMASRAFIEQVGPMTEDYLLYYEELDWAMRGRRLGFALGYAANSLVFHKEGATIGSSHRHHTSPLSLRFLTRNRLLFTRRFFPQHLLTVRLRMCLEVLVWLARRMPGHAWITLGALLGRPVKLPD